MEQENWHSHLDVAASLVLLWVVYHQFNLAIENDRLRQLFYFTFWFPFVLWLGPAFQNELPSEFEIWLGALFFASLPMSCFYLTLGLALLFKSLRSKRKHFWRLFYTTFLASIPVISFLMFTFRSQVAFLPNEFQRIQNNQTPPSPSPRKEDKQGERDEAG